MLKACTCIYANPYLTVIIKTVDDKIYKLAVPKMVRLGQSTIHRVGVNLHVLFAMPRLPPSLRNISK